MNTPAPYRPFNTAGNQAAQHISQSTTVEQSRAVAEVEAAVIVAQRMPRDIQRAEAELRDACSRLGMAEQAFYQVPNRGTGPSVHLMREAARIWGNIEHGSHELARDDNRGESEVQAFAWDKQTNTRTSRTFIAPHARMKQGQRQTLTDLGDITNNNNNVAARAVRECISNVLPRWFTELAQDLCRGTLEHGEGVPLPERIDRMINGFTGIGITQAQIELKLGKRRGQWDAGDIAQMSIAYTSITRDNLDKNEVFPPITSVTVADITAPATQPKNEPAADETTAGEPEPPADVVMVSREQMNTIANLRKREKYNIKDWLAHIENSIGAKLERVSQLTEGQAAQFIAIYEDSAQ